MPCQLSGTASESTRLYIIKESDNTLESTTVVSGAYTLSGLAVGARTIVGKSLTTHSGASFSYTGVTPAIYTDDTSGNTWGSVTQVIAKEAAGSYGTQGIYCPSVVKVSTSEYHMVYIASTSPGSATASCLMHASSTDGLTWTNHTRIVYDGMNSYVDIYVGKASLMYENGTFKMWISLTRSGRSYSDIVYATSTDCVTWSNWASVLNYGSYNGYNNYGCQSPHVIKDGSTYKIWYCGKYQNNTTTASRILYATSTDGTTWSNHAVILSANCYGSNTYTKSQVVGPVVLKTSYDYKMWFIGINDNPSYYLIYCNSSDGITWSNFKVMLNITSGASYFYLADCYGCANTYTGCALDTGTNYSYYFGGIQGASYPNMGISALVV